eukprot:gene31865-41349_t
MADFGELFWWIFYEYIFGGSRGNTYLASKRGQWMELAEDAKATIAIMEGCKK